MEDGCVIVFDLGREFVYNSIFLGEFKSKEREIIRSFRFIFGFERSSYRWRSRGFRLSLFSIVVFFLGRELDLGN